MSLEAYAYRMTLETFAGVAKEVGVGSVTVTIAGKNADGYTVEQQMNFRDIDEYLSATDTAQAAETYLAGRAAYLAHQKATEGE